MNWWVEYLLSGVATALFLSVLVLGVQFVRYALLGKLDVRELVCIRNPRTQEFQLDVDKVWIHVGRGIVSMAMLKDAAEGQPSLELQAGLFALLAGHEILRRITKKPEAVTDRRKGEQKNG